MARTGGEGEWGGRGGGVGMGTFPSDPPNPPRGHLGRTRVFRYELTPTKGSCHGEKYPHWTPHPYPEFVFPPTYVRFNGAKSKKGSVNQGVSASKKTSVLEITPRVRRIVQRAQWKNSSPCKKVLGFPGNSAPGQIYAPNPQPRFWRVFRPFFVCFGPKMGQKAQFSKYLENKAK